jgi:4,5-DOPA dioxygenase extradiol
MLPVLYLSHGSPQMVSMKHPVPDFIRSLYMSFERPKRIVVVSAHWMSSELEIMTNEEPEIIYDFYGFPDELYEMKYPIKNDLNLASEVGKAFEKSDIKYTNNEWHDGYDHGVWTMLKLLYPDALIPVVQISLPMSFSPKELSEVGAALRGLREDTLIVASGNLTHNLRGVVWDENAAVKPYAKTFRDFVVSRIESGEVEELYDLSSIPYLKENHPTLDHYLPLYVAIGASTTGQGQSLIENYMYGSLAMDQIRFN